MRNSVYLLLLGVATLSGCTTLNTKLSHIQVKVSDIFTAVRCELASAIPEGASDPMNLEGWAAIVTLVLDLEDSGSITPGLAEFTTTSGDAEVKLNASTTTAKNSVERDATFEYNIPDMAAVRDGFCPPADSKSATTGLDLGAWLRSLNAGMGDTPPGVSTKILTYQVAFTVTASTGGTLTFKTSLFTAKLGGELKKEKNSNTLKVVFTPKKDEESGEDAVLRLRLDEEKQLEEDRRTTIVVGPEQIITIE